MGNLIDLPKIDLSLVSANTRVGIADQKILVVGVMGGGSATEGELIEDLSNDKSYRDLFGRSQIDRLVTFIKKIAPGVRLDAIPLDPLPGATAANYTISFTGTATEAGSVTVIAGGKRDFSYKVGISVGDTASVIGANVAAAINANPDTVFVAANSAGVVTLIYLLGGTSGNNMPVGFTFNGSNGGSVAGITGAVAQTVTGANDPVATGTNALFDVIGEERYQAIVWPFDTLVAMDFQDARFNASNKVQDGAAFMSKIDTYANAITFAGTVNHKSGFVVGDEKVNSNEYVGPANQEHGDIQMCALAAVRALRLTEGSSLSRYLTTSASRDQIGGPASATLPYANTTIPQLSLTRSGHGFSEVEVDALNAAGITIMGTNRTGSNQVIGQVVSTYLTDPSGNPDPSWKFLNYFDTMITIREYYFSNLKKRFAQSRLTEGNALGQRDMANKEIIEGFLDRLFADISGPDFVLVQNSEAAIQYFKANRFVELDLETGTAFVTMDMPIVTQFRGMSGAIQISFSVNEA